MIATLFIILPLLSLEWLGVPSEILKVGFFLSWVVVLVGSVLIGLIKQPDSSIKSIKQPSFSIKQPDKQPDLIWRKLKLISINPIFINLVLWLFLAVISSGLNHLSCDVGCHEQYSWQRSWWGNPQRWDGLMTLSAWTLFVWSGAILWQEKRQQLQTAITIGAWLVSSWAVLSGLWQRLGWWPQLFWSGAVGVSLGNPVFLAGYLLVCLPWIWRGGQKIKPAWLRWLLLAVILTAIGFTQATAGWLGLMLWIGLELFFTKDNPHWSKLNWRKMIPVFLLGLILSTIIIFSWRNSQQELGFLTSGRRRIFTKLFLAIKEKPFFGYGWANVETAFNTAHWPLGEGLKHDVYLDKAHSSLLEALVATGVLGLATYVALIVQMIFIIYQARKRAKLEKKKQDFIWWNSALITLILFLFHAQTNVISIAEELFFWWIASLAIASSVSQPSQSS